MACKVPTCGGKVFRGVWCDWHVACIFQPEIAFTDPQMFGAWCEVHAALIQDFRTLDEVYPTHQPIAVIRSAAKVADRMEAEGVR